MPRNSRLLIPGQATVYHVMSRSALAGLPLSDTEKDHLTWLIKYIVCLSHFCGLFCLFLSSTLPLDRPAQP